MKFQGLIQIVKREWILKRIEVIMKSSGNAIILREFIMDVCEMLLFQEKHRNLPLQNNLFEKVQYYIERKQNFAKSSIVKRKNNLKVKKGDHWNYEDNQFNSMLRGKILPREFKNTFLEKGSSSKKDLTVENFASWSMSDFTHS